MRRFGLLQYPEKESLSKKIFNQYFKLSSINAKYDDIVIEPRKFDTKATEHLESYDGLNVTVPFKEDIIKFISPVEDAREINAVNCIYQNKGYNTDWKGFYNSLLDTDLKLPILLVGAGGASKAIIYGLYKLGIKHLILVNRTIEKAFKLKDFFTTKIDITVESFENLKEVMKSSKTFINATSIGMFGESFNFSSEELSNLSLIYDIVYNSTALQKQALKNGIKLIDGKTFWYYQAVENLKIWGVYDEVKFYETFVNSKFN